MNKLIRLIKSSNYVFICGNGGSAATAEHFATDLVKKGVRAICLNSNSPVITMIANDYGYEFIFSKQLDIFGTIDDLLITISCSGTSPNIRNVQCVANIKRIPIYEFETFGKIKDYGKLEDKHLALIHELVKQL